MTSRNSYEGPVRTAAEKPETMYNKLKVGTKILEDAVLNLGALPKVNKQYANKQYILQAIANRDIPALREISNYFYSTSGIYSRVCDYYAYLYRYDWYIVPQVSDSSAKKEKVLAEFDSLLCYLDNSHIQKLCGDIVLEVIKNGAYYGYLVESSKSVIIQQLPINYCRSIYKIGDQPVIEFNMRFFDDYFPDLNQRMKILKMFPAEFQKGYMLYKSGKLQKEYVPGEPNVCRGASRLISSWASGWYVLEPGSAIKFSFNNNDSPMFINAIPAIIDLDQAQDLDRRKQMQQLLKILIQKLPLDKNGDLVFDVDEARDIHNNAVEMLQHAIGVDVLTTFADIQVEDLADDNTTASSDELERVERTVYNAFGTSRNLFNTESNLGMTYSIQDDAGTMRTLLLQLHILFDNILQSKCKNKRRWCFRFFMLETTQYNYQDLAKTYKEQVQIGYSKMLPQIAMGHSQSSIIHTAYFENEILDLSELMIPPLQSSVMSAENMQVLKNRTGGTSGEGEAGRPEKPDSEKSEKTIANREAM